MNDKRGMRSDERGAMNEVWSKK